MFITKLINLKTTQIAGINEIVNYKKGLEKDDYIKYANIIEGMHSVNYMLYTLLGQSSLVDEDTLFNNYIEFSQFAYELSNKQIEKAHKESKKTGDLAEYNRCMQILDGINRANSIVTSCYQGAK